MRRKAVLITAALAVLLLPYPAAARRHRPAPLPRLFPPTADSLLLQNAEVDKLHLARVQNDREMRELVQNGELTPIQSGSALRVNVPSNRAYLRPWANAALIDLSQDFYGTFGAPLTVDSAVRTVQFQRRLRRWNRNAAPDRGPRASVHPAGIAFDLKRRGLSRAQVQWLEWRLFVLRTRGLVIIEEENRHPCLHVVVSGAYPGPVELN